MCYSDCQLVTWTLHDKYKAKTFSTRATWPKYFFGFSSKKIWFTWAKTFFGSAFVASALACRSSAARHATEQVNSSSSSSSSGDWFTWGKRRLSTKLWEDVRVNEIDGEQRASAPDHKHPTTCTITSQPLILTVTVTHMHRPVFKGVAPWPCARGPAPQRSGTTWHYQNLGSNFFSQAERVKLYHYETQQIPSYITYILNYL